MKQNQLEAVISLPSGVFKPYVGVSTAILVFTKGGKTDLVFFYDVQADGFSLDDKRDPIGDSDLSDALARWRKKSAKKDTDRTAKHFMVPVKEIEPKGYDLSINCYKEVKHEEVTVRATQEDHRQAEKARGRDRQGFGRAGGDVVTARNRQDGLSATPASIKYTRSFADAWPETAHAATPEVTPEVTPEARLLSVLQGELSRRELQDALGLKDDEHFRKAYLLAALDQGLIEMTIPDKPNSRLQKYRITAAGRALLAARRAK